jgi:hypothetical protein
MIEYADVAYSFMIGLPGWGSAGFCMMDPETLKKQRWTYVKYWLGKLERDVKRIVENSGKK